MKQFEEEISETLNKNKSDNNYYETLQELAENENLNIMACNNHKAMCKDNITGAFEVIAYIHNDYGYCLNKAEKKEVFTSWEDFKRESLKKLEVA